MIFRQLFEKDSSTYTYLLACSDTGQAMLIDPVIDTLERDLEVLHQHNLKLVYTVETHVHADHLTAARALRERTGCKVAFPVVEKPECADIGLEERIPFQMGSVVLGPLFTPGHTSHHFAYQVQDSAHSMVFTGDALLIEGCGRTDFQSGDSATLYHSIHQKLFTLPDETLVYPAHDYYNRQVSSIGQEKQRNPRLGQGKSEAEFIEIMSKLELPYPRKIKFAVPGNEACGDCPHDVPEEFRKPCDKFDQGW